MTTQRKGYYLYGLDISLKNTGVAIFDLETKEFVYIGSFSTEKIRNTKEYKGYDLNALKLHKIKEWMEELVEEYPPYFASIEQMIKKERQYGVNIDEIKAIGKATGVVQSVIWNVPQAFHYPSSVKLAIIKGNASKELVQSEILKRYPNLEFDNFDESDAVAIALTQLIEVGIVEWDRPTPVPVKKKTTRKKVNK